jgi:hypothetical protein
MDREFPTIEVIGGLAVAVVIALIAWAVIYDANHPCIEYGPNHPVTVNECVSHNQWSKYHECDRWESHQEDRRECLRRQE